MSLSQEDLKNLAKALAAVSAPAASASATSTTAAASLKLPPFWKDEPTLWFTQIESMFGTKGITQDQTKYDYVVSSLDNATAMEVKSTMLKPPNEGKYENIKTELIAAFDRTQEAKDAELLSITSIGDRLPTSHLRHLHSLNSSGETLLRALFLSHLPSEVRVIVQAQGHKDIQEMAKAADRAVQARDSSRQNNLSASAVHAKRGKKRSDKNDDNNKDRSNENSTFICYFHRKFGKRANRCQPNCIFGDKPTTTAANQVEAGNDSTDCL